MIRPIRRSHTYQAVAEAIREYILEQGLAPGQALPSERELAEMLGVSRPSVREGLRSLASSGLVQVRTGEGTFVQEVDIGKAIKDLSSVLTQDLDNIIDLQEARAALEVAAARHAALRISEEDLRLMGVNVDAYKAALDAGGDGLEEDTAFHNMVFRAARNRFLQQLGDSIADLVRIIRVTGLKLIPRPYVGYRHHRAIYKALAARDVAAAAAAMQEHMDFVRRQLVEIQRQQRGG